MVTDLLKRFARTRLWLVMVFAIAVVMISLAVVIDHMLAMADEWCRQMRGEAVWLADQWRKDGKR